MPTFTLHTAASAPDEARPLLERSAKTLGFVPNLYAGLAESPAALGAYFDLSAALAKTQLTPVEQQVVLLTASAENGCSYCMAAHSAIARNMVKMDAALLEALRRQQPLPDPKLDALARFTRQMVEQRGWLDAATVQAFLDAGYSRAHVLDVLVGVTMKTLSNYANHLLHTPVDDAFAAERWQPEGT